VLCSIKNEKTKKEGLGFSIILILIPILIIDIPIGLSYITNRVLKKKGVSLKWRLL
jgi:hypothetical protein